MSLQVWLPLNGDLNNQGLNNITVVNNGATINNSGKIGKCYSFNGSSNYLRIPYNFYNSTFSFSAWVYTTSSTTQTICCNRNGTGLGFSIFLISGKLRIDSGITNTNQQWVTNYTFSQNQWFHLTVTRDSTTVKYYINGVFQEEYSTALSNLKWSSTTTFGASQSNGSSYGNYLNGYLNDIRIYDHALSKKEVEEIAKGLVLHYKLDEDNEISQNYIDTIPSGNVYANPTFDSNTDWLHWGPSGSIHTYGQNSDKQYIFNQNKNYSHYISEDTGTGKYYLLYQTKDSPGGARSLQCILKEENSLPITSSIVWPTLNSRTGGAAANRWTSIKPLGNGFYYCKYENVIQSQQTGTNALFGIGVSPGYKVYVSEMCLENSETCTSIFSGITTIHDCSGYNNHGTVIGTLGVATDSPRYNIATQFTGSASSVIKVNENNWCSQGMPEMTINLWAKTAATSWTPKIFSCTESGGFNTEAGSSGYWRFPIHVYTNAAQTTTAYKYDSKEIQISDLSTTDWVMFTFVYDSSGTKTYLNGQLHHTYTNTSYGIHFNMNARLFLGCEANTASPTSPYFNGYESDFRIYTTALSAAAIKELYDTSVSIDASGNVYARELKEV